LPLPRQLAEQSGLKLLYAADLLSGKTARIAGKLTPQQALERLLAAAGCVISLLRRMR
jgi:hypothetical protein